MARKEVVPPVVTRPRHLPQGPRSAAGFKLGQQRRPVSQQARGPGLPGRQGEETGPLALDTISVLFFLKGIFYYV